MSHYCQIDFRVHNYATSLRAILISLHFLSLLSAAPDVNEMFLQSVYLPISRGLSILLVYAIRSMANAGENNLFQLLPVPGCFLFVHKLDQAYPLMQDE